MSALTQLAWTQFWQTSAVALAVGFAAWASCRRRPHLAYLLWIVVILKCLTPPVWSSPTGLFSWALVSRSAAESFEAITTIGTGPAHPDAAATLSPTSQPAVSTQKTNVAPTSPWTIAVTAVGMIWLSGVLGCAGFVLVSFWRVWSRLRCSALPLEPRWSTQFDACADRLALRRRVRLVVTTQPIGPAVFGFLRPVVVLPHSLVTCPEQIALTPILSHELIHIRRADPLVAVVQVFAQCLWWFHPLVWWANRQASRERERACDEEVLAELKLDPAAYGQSLLHILRMKRSLQPVLAFPGVRPVEVTARRLAHIMQEEPRFHSRTPRRHWVMALVAAALLLPGGSFALDSARQRNSPAESPRKPQSSAKVQRGSDVPNFFVIPIRTELQRKLVADGKPVHALVELNGFAPIGKRGDDRMRALDIVELRRSLAAIKGGDANASIVFVIGYLSLIPRGMEGMLPHEQNLLTQECRDLAEEAKLGVARISNTWVNVETPGLWPKVVAAVKDIDLAKDTAAESAVGDSEVSAYPVRTRVTRFLTDQSTGGNSPGSDCVVYIHKPLNASDDPLIGPDFVAHIKRVVSKLDLPRKDRIDFHLTRPKLSPAADQDHRDAIMNRFIGNANESGHLATRLGFKGSSVTW
jgi:beta-lactamase regulating signal transducer with metallopeptidase domain